MRGLNPDRTDPIERPYLEVLSRSSSNILSDEDLIFKVSVANTGVDSSSFSLYIDVPSNQDGLDVYMDGYPLENGLQNFLSLGSFMAEYTETISKVIKIKRGPLRFIYSPLTMYLTSSCDGNAATSVDLYNDIGSRSLIWLDYCPVVEWALDIGMNAGFVVNTGSSDLSRIPVAIFNPLYMNYPLKNHSRLIDSSASVVFEYRLVGAYSWNPGYTIVDGRVMKFNFISQSFNEDSYGYTSGFWYIDPSFVPDGYYEIRVRVECDNLSSRSKRFLSSTVTGAIDRTYPKKYGDPIPLDNGLHVGEEISVFFTKPLLCIPIPFNIRLKIGATLATMSSGSNFLSLTNDQLLIRCHENVISFVTDLTQVDYKLLVGKPFTVEMGKVYLKSAAIRDSNGNPTDPNKGNIIFEKTFLPMGLDMQTSFTFSLSASGSGSNICAVCGNSTKPQNCTTSKMRQYQETTLRSQLTPIMTLNATDRISITNIDCTSKTVSGTVTFTDPPKPTPSPTFTPTIFPTRSMKPTRNPSKKPTSKPSKMTSSKPSRKPTRKPSSLPTIRTTRIPFKSPTTKPTVKPTAVPTHLQFRSFSGLIYNKANGQCMVPSSQGLATATLSLCDDSSFSQRWQSVHVQGFSTFLLNQTSSNGCLDGGNMTNGTVLSIKPCNISSSSQRWTFDYFNYNLRSTAKSSLCVAVSSLLTVILSACSNQFINYNQGWGDISLYGGLGGTNNFTYFTCPPGEKVTRIFGRAGDWVNQISMKCDNGHILGPVGSQSGGNRVTGSDCLEGYQGLAITSGSFVGKIDATCSRPLGSISFGTATSSYGSGSIDQTVCERNEKIIGFYSRSGDYVDAMNVVCGQVLTNPTARPTTIPTIRPSSKPSIQPSTRPTALPTKRPSSRPSIHPSTRPTLRPTRRPSSKPTVHPSSKPSNKTSARPSIKPITSPSRKPTRKPNSIPSRKPTRKPSSIPSRRPRSKAPTRRPRSTSPTNRPRSKAPTKKPGNRRVAEIIINEDQSFSSVELFMDFMRGMLVSESLQHGRHLRLVTQKPESYEFTDIRISNIVMVAKNTSSSSKHDIQSWTLLDSKSTSLGIGLLRSSSHIACSSSSNLNIPDHSFDHLKDLVKSEVSDVIKSEASHIKKEVSDLITKQNDLITKQNEMEKKLDHLSQLLERILLANP